ncbi:hypothetical protein [Niabella ginsengisoli]|uniref:Uncharacterized protein n=1 Tax=Niabella ginsengisoli TaxID=522298 RepID=A0ABS9SRQ0_9BACT|nr:hypothetical protein [Niabella ginsengisoli]MCH5600936.1 hypothetical protein [Niabella ginsengisoli]
MCTLFTLFLLSAISSVSFAQCETINGTYPATTEWQQTNTGGIQANRYIYDDGTNIRLANKSDNSRIGLTASYYNTIVKSAEAINLTNQMSTVEVVYKPGAATQNYNTWTMGWSYGASFPGAAYNQVDPPIFGTYSNIWLANVYGQDNILYVNTAQGNLALNSAPFSYVLTYGDSISASLVPQPDGTAAMHVVVKRVVGGVSTTVVDYYQYNAVTAANVTYSTTDAVHPALTIPSGATNLGCLQNDVVNYTPASPVAQACEEINGYPTTSDWQQRNTGGGAASSYIYNDGTNIRLALVATNDRITSAPNYNVIVKSGEPNDLSTHATSITATYKQGNNTQNFDVFVLGWAANPNFNGIGYNVINHSSYGINYTTNWSANVYIQGNQLYINDYSSYIEVVPNYTPTYGDVITASLEPQPDGTAALHVVATRVVGGISKEVLNIYDFVAVDAGVLAMARFTLQ